jgi:hypothetical protein
MRDTETVMDGWIYWSSNNDIMSGRKEKKREENAANIVYCCVPFCLFGVLVVVAVAGHCLAQQHPLYCSSYPFHIF